jgi:hypothetical protein
MLKHRNLLWVHFYPSLCGLHHPKSPASIIFCDEWFSFLWWIWLSLLFSIVEQKKWLSHSGFLRKSNFLFFSFVHYFCQDEILLRWGLAPSLLCSWKFAWSTWPYLFYSSQGHHEELFWNIPSSCNFCTPSKSCSLSQVTELAKVVEVGLLEGQYITSEYSLPRS